MVRKHDNADLISEEIRAVKTKFVRAARASDGDDGQQFAKDTLDESRTGRPTRKSSGRSPSPSRRPNPSAAGAYGA